MASIRMANDQKDIFDMRYKNVYRQILITFKPLIAHRHTKNRRNETKRIETFDQIALERLNQITEYSNIYFF